MYVPDGSLGLSEYLAGALPVESVVADSLVVAPAGVVTVTVTGAPASGCDPVLATTVMFAARLLPFPLMAAETVALMAVVGAMALAVPDAVPFNPPVPIRCGNAERRRARCRRRQRQ